MASILIYGTIQKHIIDYVESLKKMQPAKMVTQGYLFSKDKKLVTTFASYDESEATFSDVNVIPRGVVKKMTKIEL